MHWGCIVFSKNRTKDYEIQDLKAELEKANQVITQQQAHNQAMEKAFKKCCTLYDVSKSGRVLTLRFQRDGKPFELEVFAEMGTTAEMIKAQAGLS